MQNIFNLYTSANAAEKWIFRSWHLFFILLLFFYQFNLLKAFYRDNLVIDQIATDK